MASRQGGAVVSEPKRYEAMGPEVIATPTGEYVRYEDYTRLKAEVERLTKAGDLMWNALLCSGCSECMGMYDCHEDGMKAWEDAKEGKQP